jgi:hypothetical protein
MSAHVTLFPPSQERAKLPPVPPGAPRPPVRTWIHDIFQGTLTNQTRCMWCEAVTNREESYLDLSLDIAHNASVSTCLSAFSAVETLAGADKFHCDACAGLQEAQKRLLIRGAPPVLALHLKRFKFVEALGAYTKLMHRVSFPTHLRLDGTCVEAGSPTRDAAYALFAVVVHVGSGANHGHYVAVVKQQPPPPPAVPPMGAVVAAPGAAIGAAASGAAAALRGLSSGAGVAAAAAAAGASAAASAAAAAAAAAVSNGSQWVHFDDESVEAVSESVLTRLFGAETPPPPLVLPPTPGDAGATSAPPSPMGDTAPPLAPAAPPSPAGQPASSTDHGYILFYERIRTEEPPPLAADAPSSLLWAR